MTKKIYKVIENYTPEGPDDGIKLQIDDILDELSNSDADEDIIYAKNRNTNETGFAQVEYLKDITGEQNTSNQVNIPAPPKIQNNNIPVPPQQSNIPAPPKIQNNNIPVPPQQSNIPAPPKISIDQIQQNSKSQNTSEQAKINEVKIQQEKPQEITQISPQVKQEAEQMLQKLNKLQISDESYKKLDQMIEEQDKKLAELQDRRKKDYEQIRIILGNEIQQAEITEDQTLAPLLILGQIDQLINKEIENIKKNQ